MFALLGDRDRTLPTCGRMRRLGVCLFVFSVFSNLNTPCWADGPGGEGTRDRAQSIDSVLVGGSAVLKDPGELDFTFGTSYEDDNGQDNSELFVEVEYGVNEWLEVGFKAPFLFIDPNEADEPRVSGWGDLEFSIAFALIDDPFLLTPSLTVTLPTGDEDHSDDLGEGDTIWEPMINAEFSWEDLELIFGVGGEFTGHSAALLYEFTVAREFNEFSEFNEVVLSMGIDGVHDDQGGVEFSLVPGIGFELFEDIDLGVEGMIGLTDDTPDWGLTIEITFGF